MKILLFFSLSERCAGWQKFLTDRRFLAYDVIWVLIWNYMHIWYSYLKIWPKIQKMKEKESFLIKNPIKWYIKIWYADMLQNKKSWKNDFIMIILCSSIFKHHIPKIDDQTEISGTPRALNQQHLQTLRKIFKFIATLWRFYWFFRHLRGARGGRNFWPIGDFWLMRSYECWYAIICIRDIHIWKYDQISKNKG